MQFTIGKATVNIDVPEGADDDRVASLFVADPEVASALRKHAKSFYYSAWDSDALEQKTIDKVIGVALEDGTEAAITYLIENDFDRSVSDHFHHSDGRESTKNLLADFIDKFAEIRGIDEDSAEHESFVETLMDRVVPEIEEGMHAADTSKPADVFSRHAEVKVVFIQGYGTRGYLDDIYSSHADNCCQSDTVKPDRDLMLQFKLLNISPVEFVEYYKAKRGQDLMNPEFGDDVSDYYRRQIIENAQAWAYACAVFRGEDVSDLEIPDWLSYGRRAEETADVIRGCRDLDRPSAVSLETLETILDNSSYGGVATWYGRVSAKEIMEGQFESSFLATGGQIGIHDFINGSGYVSNVENDVLIDLRDGKLLQEDRFSYGPESVYGFTRKATDTETNGVKLSDWKRYGEGQWRTFATRDDDLYAKIEKGTEIDGSEFFRISTLNSDNVPAGPIAEYITAGSLAEAQEETTLYFAPAVPTSEAGVSGHAPGL